MATKMQNRERLLRKMAALPQHVRSQIKQALAESADELIAMQKRLVPVASGKLRDSITQTWGAFTTTERVGGRMRKRQAVKYASLKGGAGEGDPDLTVTITAGNSDVRYAHLVEFPTPPHINAGRFKGTRHPGTTAQPFFYPPYRALKRRMKSRITRATKKAARTVAGQR